MLSVLGRGTKLCDGVTRREVMRVGGLALGGLTLADLLRQPAEAAPAAGRAKSVILIWLRGGASHIDSYDMKPDAPAEVRGEFSPISTNVPGIQVCEHLPRHARMMDRLAIIRGIRSNDLGDHTPHYIVTGFPDRGKRPAIGSIVSYLRPRTDGLPSYVSMMYREDGTHENATYTGPAHRPFAPNGEALANLSLPRGVSPDRLRFRQHLLRQFDTLSRDIDRNGAFAARDAATARALQLIASPAAREAFDLGKESAATRERYGKYSEHMLMARRLVEAGIPVVTLKVGDWDTHEKNFRDMREQLPQLDQGFHALVSDLHDRGLDKEVAVVLWGEFGRAPKISRGDGRDHWPDAGAAVIAGGGFKTGQVIGATDAHGGYPTGTPYTPANVIATLYRHLGINPTASIPDHEGRPMQVLDDPNPIRELL
ncbi:MAG: DUF1501 domain-containing protein [Actinomycetota bacterium]